MSWQPRPPRPGESWRTPTDAEIAGIVADAEAALRDRFPSYLWLTVEADAARDVAQRPDIDGDCCLGRAEVGLTDGRALRWRIWINIRTGGRRLRREEDWFDRWQEEKRRVRAAAAVVHEGDPERHQTWQFRRRRNDVPAH
jgi:hypothetical protein